MTDVAAWLAAQLDEDEQIALAATAGPWAAEGNGSIVGPAGPQPKLAGHVVCSVGAWNVGFPTAADAAHIVRHDPARVLRQVAAHRHILAEVMSWTHAYNDDDYWFSCGLAVAPGETEPGSGCGNDDHVGRCTCGLVGRRMRLLAPLAAVYAGRDGYDPAWTVGT